MRVKEWILGFDAREMWNYEDVQAMGARTATSTGFLRNGIKKGLSVDQSIWGSVFDSGDYPTLVGEERRHVGLGTLKLPDWIGENNPLWENLSDLEKYLKKHELETIKPYWIIGITLISQPEDIKISNSEWPSFEPTIPPIRESSWRNIGFDIADQSMEAHLTGTAFNGDEQYINALCNRWGPLLNEYHLFREIEHALRFKEEMIETLDQDYMPFFVYGIWLIREVEK